MQDYFLFYFLILIFFMGYMSLLNLIYCHEYISINIVYIFLVFDLLSQTQQSYDKALMVMILYDKILKKT